MEKINAHVWSRYEDLLGNCLNIVAALDIVTERQMSMMKMYFQERKTLEEIGIIASLTKERVRQIIEKGVRTLNSKSQLKIDEINTLKHQRDNEMPLIKRELKIKTDKIIKIQSVMRSCLDFNVDYHGEDAHIGDLDLSVRLFNILSSAGIRSLKELAMANKEDLMKHRNMGRRTMDEIESVLAEYGYV